MNFPPRRAVWAAMFLAAGCASRPPRARDASTQPAVRAAMAGFLDALNALDADRINAMFTDDVTAFVTGTQAEAAVGRPAVSQIFRVFVERLKLTNARVNVVPEDERVEASSTVGVVSFQIRDTTPAVIVRRRTFVFRRVGDRWLISHFHASDMVPPGK